MYSYVLVCVGVYANDSRVYVEGERRGSVGGSVGCMCICVVLWLLVCVWLLA